MRLVTIKTIDRHSVEDIKCVNDTMVRAQGIMLQKEMIVISQYMVFKTIRLNKIIKE